MNYNDINDEFDMENILHLNRKKPEVPKFFDILNNRQFKSRFRLSKDVAICLINFSISILMTILLKILRFYGLYTL